LDIVNDSVVEPDETIELTLDDVRQVTPGDANNNGMAQKDTTYTIRNNDVASITVQDVVAFEGTSGTPTKFEFTVAVSNGVQGGFKLPYQTVEDAANPNRAKPGDDFTVVNGELDFSDETVKSQTFTVLVAPDLLLEQNESFLIQLGPLEVNDRDIEPGDVTLQDERALGTILNDDVVPPPFETPEPQLPTPLPVLFTAVDIPVVYRSQTQVIEAGDWAQAAAEAGRVQEDVVVLKLVVPLGDGTFQEQEVARLPVDQLGKISEWLRRLPDDRYRFYYLRRDGASWLILDVMLREGKPVDPAEVAPDGGAVPGQTPTAEPAQPADGGPPAAQPALEAVPVPIRAEPEPAGPASPAAGPDATAAGHPWRTHQALASGAALAACLPWADWQQRVHAALAQDPRRALQTKVRRRRRVPADGATRE